MQEERYLSSFEKNLDEHLRNELNHEEPPWRTPVTKGWRDKMKDERIIWALWWFIWRFRRDGRGNLNYGKEKMKTLGTRIYSLRTNSKEKEGITRLDEIRIRFIVCLSFIKLNWRQAMDFASYLFFLKRIEKWHIANLRRSSWTTGRIGKNEWIKMITQEKNLKEPPLEFGNDWRKRMNHREELGEQIC